MPEGKTITWKTPTVSNWGDWGWENGLAQTHCVQKHANEPGYAAQGKCKPSYDVIVDYREDNGYPTDITYVYKTVQVPDNPKPTKRNLAPGTEVTDKRGSKLKSRNPKQHRGTIVNDDLSKCKSFEHAVKSWGSVKDYVCRMDKDLKVVESEAVSTLDTD